MTATADRCMTLRDVEVKFLRDDLTGQGDKAARRWVALVVQGHPCEAEVEDAVESMLSLEADGELDYFSTPLRTPKESLEGRDARRFLKATLLGRVPLQRQDGAVRECWGQLWPGQLVDVNLRLHLTTVQVPQDFRRVCLVYANALGFRLVGGLPRGLENL